MEDDNRHFTLDGTVIPFTKGDTIMVAAQNAGVYIPHLCYHSGLPAHGSCRLCIVSIKGKIVSACTQPAEHQQEISSQTDAIGQSRLRLIQLLFAEGNHFCPSCEVSGNCQLQALAYDLGMTHYEYQPFAAVRQQDGSHAELFIDQDRCIFCDLCGRASTTLDNKSAFGLSGRGSNTHLFFRSSSGDLADTSVTEQDHAAHICPVGCILPKHGNYRDAIGSRLYDTNNIHSIGNLRQDSKDEQ
jgi:[NiFe] hydrogenase diaphorase moiety small subunit